MGKPTFDIHNCKSVESRICIYGYQKKVFVPEYIGYKSEPGELKHLSTRRKGHQRDSVSSGERTRTRPAPLFLQPERIGKSGLSG